MLHFFVFGTAVVPIWHHKLFKLVSVLAQLIVHCCGNNVDQLVGTSELRGPQFSAWVGPVMMTLWIRSLLCALLLRFSWVYFYLISVKHSPGKRKTFILKQSNSRTFVNILDIGLMVLSTLPELCAWISFKWDQTYNSKH